MDLEKIKQDAERALEWKNHLMWYAANTPGRRLLDQHVPALIAEVEKVAGAVFGWDHGAECDVTLDPHADADCTCGLDEAKNRLAGVG